MTGRAEAKILGPFLRMEMRGELGRTIERWRVTSLIGLRDAIDAAIEIVTEAGGADICLDRVDVALAHFPRGPGKPYRVSIGKPVRLADDE